jgi:hypothetical protein
VENILSRLIPRTKNETLKCYNTECNYTEQVDIELYLHIHDDAPILVAPLETEEIEEKVEELLINGTFRTVEEMDLFSRDKIRRYLEYRRKKLEKEIYQIDRTLVLFDKSKRNV